MDLKNGKVYTIIKNVVDGQKNMFCPKMSASEPHMNLQKLNIFEKCFSNYHIFLFQIGPEHVDEFKKIKTIFSR